LQMINNQEINNTLMILKYKSFKKKSRKRFKQLNANNTIILNTQNEKLWIHNVR
jgi:hypothetical protein